MEMKDFYRENMAVAIFKDNKLTFELEDGFILRTGKYAILSEEGFKNFASELCQRQRELCAKHHDNPIEISAYNAILNAEQPKIEDIMIKK